MFIQQRLIVCWELQPLIGPLGVRLEELLEADEVVIVEKVEEEEEEEEDVMEIELDEVLDEEVGDGSLLEELELLDQVVVE